MDSERGPATAGPRIVYILSCGGLSVSALGLFPKKKKKILYNFTEFWGDTIAPSQSWSFFACALAILLHLTKMNRDVLEQVYIFVINKS